MNVLVLGGHGFIGSHIVEELVNAGHRVRLFSRKSFECINGVEEFLGDFLDKGKLSESLIGMDTVVHCVSSTVPATSAANPVYDIESNLIGTVELLQLMQAQGVRRLIYLSSGGTVYGNPISIPISEDALLKPISSYGAVKVAIESFIAVAQSNWGIQPIVLRLSNPFGERQGHNGVQGLISTVLNNTIHGLPTIIYGDGSVIRDYIYVKDVAVLVSKALLSDRCGIYNVGSGQGVSINEIINIIEGVIGDKVQQEYKHQRKFDVKEVVLDSSKASSHFDWIPAVSLALGIRKQFDWLKEQ